VTRAPPSPETVEEYRARFWREFEALLEKANFEKINRDEFEKAVRAGTTRGVHVDVNLDLYAEFAFYFRGRGEVIRTVRGVKTKFRKKSLSEPIYLRAVIATRMEEEPHIQLRLFKEIPQRDIESILPGTKLCMRILDKLKLTGTGGVAVYSAFRIALQGAILVGKAFLLPLVFVAGLAYLGRTAFRFFKIRDEYRKNLIRDLYFQSLDSNLGVINRIIDSTEEEECKEAFLAYAIALARGPGLSREELGGEIRRFLLEGWELEPVFDLEDALAKLDAFGLVAETAEGLRALPLEQAISVLDQAWDSLYDAEGEKAEKSETRS